MNISRILSLPTHLSMADSKTTSQSNHNIIAIASGKGGVGKTCLSIGLAHAFAKKGEKVLLFDGDLGLANVDIQLGLVVQYDLGSIITGKVPMTQVISRSELGFDVIAGRSGSGSLANIPLSRLQLIFDDLRLLSSQYDRVIIDLGAGVEKAVRLFAQKAGTLLVVCTDEPTSLTDAYAFIKIISTENPDIEIQTIINNVSSTKEGEKTYNTLLKACQNFLHITPTLAGIVRRDIRIRDAIRAQTSILEAFPNTTAALDIEKLANNL